MSSALHHMTLLSLSDLLDELESLCTDSLSKQLQLCAIKDTSLTVDRCLMQFGQLVMTDYENGVKNRLLSGDIDDINYNIRKMGIVDYREIVLRLCEKFKVLNLRCYEGDRLLVKLCSLLRCLCVSDVCERVQACVDKIVSCLKLSTNNGSEFCFDVTASYLARLML